MGKWLKTIGYLIGSALLTHLLPFSSFFRNVDTMIHEFGHAVITLLLSGQVMYIELYVDHSGVTRSSVTESWSMVPIALAGYMTASLFAWLLFSLYAKGRQRTGLMLMLVVAVISLFLFVRNPFGMTWLAGFIVVNGLAIIWGGGGLGRFYYLLIAFLSLEESVFGPISLLIGSLMNPAQAGDASVLASDTPFPAAVWTCWFTVFSLWCAKGAIGAFAGRRKRSKPRAGHPAIY